jgi:hypothetical protein
VQVLEEQDEGPCDGFFGSPEAAVAWNNDLFFALPPVMTLELAHKSLLGELEDLHPCICV